MEPAIRPDGAPSVPLDVVARELDVPSAGPGVVAGIALASSAVRPGMLFAALPGRAAHGADHSRAARDAGAAAVLTDPAGEAAARRSGLPVLVVADPRARLGAIARLLSGTGDLPFALFGVTGTNGKTSTVHLLEALMRRLGWRTALSSTVERRIGDDAQPSDLTTPEAPELHAFLARAAEQGVQGTALEVSAQGLTRHRTDGIVVDVAGFTNLSHDHLDDYPDMAAYLAAKALLFTPEHARAAVVSLDSAAGRQITETARIPVTTISSDPDTDSDWVVRVREHRPDGTRATLTAPDGTVLDLDVPLLGVHMVANAGLAVAMLSAAGVQFDALRDATAGRLDVVVPGRMADASAATGPRVFVDFAHTPDAFTKSLDAVRAFTTGRVAIVVGADGDRDPSKRRAMGLAAATGADVVVVADHHPRFEAPGPIRRALLEGARAAGSAALVAEVPEPARAIRRALDEVGDDGAVYWAGPGLTDYRDIGGEHVPYSSFRDARAALAERGHGPSD